MCIRDRVWWVSFITLTIFSRTSPAMIGDGTLQVSKPSGCSISRLRVTDYRSWDTDISYKRSMNRGVTPTFSNCKVRWNWIQIYTWTQRQNVFTRESCMNTSMPIMMPRKLSDVNLKYYKWVHSEWWILIVFIGISEKDDNQKIWKKLSQPTP